MTWEAPLSAAQMAAVLDNAPVAIYVSALDSYELLYANQLAKKLFDCEEDTPGLTCYQAAGFTPVSYTHLDVYKRQGLDYAVEALRKEDEPLAVYLFCLLYTSIPG